MRRYARLAVQGDKPSEGEGWYYDDFTKGLDRMCSGGLSRRFAFSSEARAPQGVSVKVDCEGGAALQ